MTDDALPARSATIRSRIPHADAVAAAIAPDDTDEIDTRVEDGAVVTDIERPTTASLEATIDDYVVALDVATEVASIDALPDDEFGEDDTAVRDGASADARDGASADAQDGDQSSDRDETVGSGDDRAGDDTTDAHDTQ